jgi:hypothetical protein
VTLSHNLDRAGDYLCVPIGIIRWRDLLGCCHCRASGLLAEQVSTILAELGRSAVQ